LTDKRRYVFRKRLERKTLCYSEKGFEPIDIDAEDDVSMSRVRRGSPYNRTG
jgi:hypothetical protein